MSGAAFESILLALTIAKVQDEPRVLAAYLKANGRQNVLNMLTTGLSASLRNSINAAAGLLSYWRDTASHGHSTSISEFEAHDAMSRLLRFAQFAQDNWVTLTA